MSFAQEYPRTIAYHANVLGWVVTFGALPYRISVKAFLSASEYESPSKYRDSESFSSSESMICSVNDNIKLM